MDYEQFYDFVIQEERRLEQQDITDDYRLCKALAACYELQDYLANQIAQMVERRVIDDY